MAESEPPQTTAPAPAEGAPEPNEAGRRTYLGSIKHAAQSIFEGLSITWTEMLRMPQNRTTVQYPDRTPFPVADSLPERYRGFLEVDMDICTACKACERDCPINCIVIDLGKIEGTRAMTRFDIDLGKCMYCGICVEACPTDAQAAGDAEPTKCIRMTREFEAVTSDFSTLTFRFIRPGDYIVPYKPKKGEISDTHRRGEIAREVRQRAAEYNHLAIQWALANGGAKKGGALEEVIKVAKPAGEATSYHEYALEIARRDGEARKAYESLGFRVVQVPGAGMINFGGSIHCISMQIPK